MLTKADLEKIVEEICINKNYTYLIDNYSFEERKNLLNNYDEISYVMNDASNEQIYVFVKNIFTEEESYKLYKELEPQIGKNEDDSFILKLAAVLPGIDDEIKKSLLQNLVYDDFVIKDIIIPSFKDEKLKKYYEEYYDIDKQLDKLSTDEEKMRFLENLSRPWNKIKVIGSFESDNLKYDHILKENYDEYDIIEIINTIKDNEVLYKISLKITSESDLVNVLYLMNDEYKVKLLKEILYERTDIKLYGSYIKEYLCELDIKYHDEVFKDSSIFYNKEKINKYNSESIFYNIKYSDRINEIIYELVKSRKMSIGFLINGVKSDKVKYEILKKQEIELSDKEMTQLFESIDDKYKLDLMPIIKDRISILDILSSLNSNEEKLKLIKSFSEEESNEFKSKICDTSTYKVMLENEYLFKNILFGKEINLGLTHEEKVDIIWKLSDGVKINVIKNKNEYEELTEDDIENIIKGIQYINSMDKKFLTEIFTEYRSLILLFSTFTTNNLSKLYSRIQIEDYKDIFNKLLDSDDYIKISVVLSKYNKDKIDNPDLKEIYNELYDKVISYYKETDVKLEWVQEIINNGRNPYPLQYIKTEKEAYVNANMIDVLSNRETDYINTIPEEVLQKINKKHFRTIVSLLEGHYVEHDTIFNVALNMYLTLGYSRCIDLLNPNENKNYGEIDDEKIKRIFTNINISDVTFIEDGKGYVPLINETLINLIFGSNYKIKNTPIRNYLNDYEDKKEEINKKIEKLMSKDDISEVDKKAIKANYEKELRDYKIAIEEFFANNLSQAFYKWDVLEEEFLKKQNKSKLDLKLNIEQVNQICKALKSIENAPVLEEQDALLSESSVFDYVGFDTQYTSNIETVRQRTVELSRGMSKVKTKKFPNISLEKEGLYLRVYNPQDRDILSAGIRSGCCFRPNANADDQGKNKSLLQYCTNTPYGGGLEIVDKEGKIIMFSPLLRNGNVLMIHSFETKEILEHEKQIAFALLKEYSEKVIKESNENGDDISYVLMTDLHIDRIPDYATIKLPEAKKFKAFTEIEEYDGYKGMYTNLSCNHSLLAHKEGKTFDEIIYGSVEKDYDYPKIIVPSKYVSISEEDIDIIKKIIETKSEIIEASNKRKLLEFAANRNEVLTEIKNMKNEYLKMRKYLFEKYPTADIFQLYNNGIKVIKNLNEEKGFDIPKIPTMLYYTADWFIAIENNVVYGGFTPEGENEYNKILSELMSVNSDLKMNGEDLSETGKNARKN